MHRASDLRASFSGTRSPLSRSRWIANTPRKGRCRVEGSLRTPTVPVDLYSIIRTSPDTAEAEAIVLRETATTRLVFKSTLVNNARDAAAPVQGTFCFQRKSPKGKWEDHNEVPLSRLRADEWLRLELGAGEVHQLLGHVAGLYRQYQKDGLPRGKTHFLRIGTDEDGARDLLRADLGRLLDTINRTGVDVATRVLEWMAEAENAPGILNQLQRLRLESLQQINSLIGITNLKALHQLWRDNQENADEEFWQQTLQRHAFTLTQVFAFPVVLFRGKAYVGGKGLENIGGNIADFLAANRLTGNAVLIEIKTPVTNLLGKEYRTGGGGIYGASDELSGAIAQVLAYRHSLQRESDAIGRDYRDRVEAFSPQCLVVAGHAGRELTDPARRRSFELLRDSIKSGVALLTYDELFEKVQALLETLEGDTAEVPPG